MTTTMSTGAKLKERRPDSGAQGTQAVLFGAILALMVVGYVVVEIVHPVGLGPLVTGLVNGGLASLTAMGLVLIYRAFRVVNFSQQVMGGLAATMVVVLVEGGRAPYAVAVVIGLVVAALTGLLVELGVMRRLANAPRLIVTVATIGVYQILGAAELGLPNLFPVSGTHGQGLVTPFHARAFALGGYQFTWDAVVAMAFVPVALGAMYFFFVHTDFGVAIRGAADSQERAMLLGIPVRTLSRITWIVAATLSGFGAILSAPDSVGGFSIGAVSGASTLLLPLAAAVLAGMESFPATVFWSLVLGVVNSVVLAVTLKQPYVDIAQFVVILLGLLLVRRRTTRVDDGGLGDFVAIREVSSIPRYLSALPQVRSAKIIVAVVVAAAAALGPILLNPSKQLLMANIAIYAMIGISIVVLTGWAGQISLGQFAFVGVGSAAASALLVHQNVNFVVAVLASAAVGAVVAVVVGIPALRISGLYLAVATLAFAVPVSSYVVSAEYIPLLNPTQVNRPILFGRFDLGSQLTFYEVCLVLLLGTIVAVHNLRGRRTGRNIVAVRDNSRGAAAYGVNPLRTKLLAFVLSGAIAGLAGALYVVGLEGNKGGGIPPDLSLTVFVMVVIGGLGSLTGAIVGACYVQAATYFLPASWQLVATGAGLTILLLIQPEGIGAWFFQLRDWWLASVVAKTGARPSMDHVTLAHMNDHVRDAAAKIGELEVMEESADAKAPDALPPNQLPSVAGVADIDVGYTARTKVVHDVGLGVAQGEVVALLGTNGAGKTTVLRAIAGLLSPSTGSIRFAGQDITTLNTADRVKGGVVTVLGGRSVFSSLTVEENLRLATWTARKYQKDPHFAAAATERVLTMFPVLRARHDQRAGLLSGGEQQMLTLAQALLCRPKLLMIDELSLGLAPSIVAELLEVIRALAASGVTVMIVEQSVNVATAISGRAIFMERGRVRFSGPTPDLSQQPKLLRAVFLSAAKRAKRRQEIAAQQATPLFSNAPGPNASGSYGAPPPAFAVVGATKFFGGITALTDINFAVEPGEILGIIGSNGAGKTTLFDVCSGFTVPDHGWVAMEGRDITSLSPSSRATRGLGRIFQDARLFPAMTVSNVLAVALEQALPVRDPIAEMLSLSSVIRAEHAIAHRVDELVELLSLTRYRDTFVSELSTGTRRVLELGCAIAHRPKVLLLDEPTSGIAQRESEALGELLLGLREETGAAFVVIEHDVPLVSSIADRLMCMHVGRIISEGTTSEVLNDPSVIAAYLGTDEAAARRSGAPVSRRPPIPGTAGDLVGAGAPQAGMAQPPMPPVQPGGGF